MTKYDAMNNETNMPILLSIVFFIVFYFIHEDFNISRLYLHILVIALVLIEVILQKKVYINKITICYFLLVLSVTFFSFLPNAFIDLKGVNHIISMLVFFVAYLFAFPSVKELNVSRTLLLVSAFVVAVYILVVKVSPDVFWNNVYPYLSQGSQAQAQRLMRSLNYGVLLGGDVANSDYLLAMAVFVFIGGCFSSLVITDKKVSSYGISLFLLIAITIVNRRSELISVLVSILAMYFVSVKTVLSLKIKLKKLKYGGFVCVIIALLAMFMYHCGLFDRYIRTIEEISSGTNYGIEKAGNGRIELWSSALTMYEGSSYLIGIGWAQFRNRNFLGSMEGMNVHNDYLQWLCETGIIGFMIIFGSIIYIWLKTLKRCKYVFNTANGIDFESRYFVLISFGIQTFFIILHFMDPCFYKILFWPIYSYSLIMYRQSEMRENRLLSK